MYMYHFSNILSFDVIVFKNDVLSLVRLFFLKKVIKKDRKLNKKAQKLKETHSKRKAVFSCRRINMRQPINIIANTTTNKPDKI